MTRTPLQIPLPHLSGQLAVVTGASDGVGRVIASRLAQAGAELILPVRNQAKGRAAINHITDRHPGAVLSLRQLDLSSLDSVAELGERLRAEARPISILVNNAGVMTPPQRQQTVDGCELQWGTNHLGHAALVGHLLPLLREGGARVVSQLSIAAHRHAIHWEDLNWERSYHGFRAYSQSKIAMGMFGMELHRRSRELGWGITSVLCHPGVAPTNLLGARPEVGRSRATLSMRAIRLLSARGLVMGTVASAALPAVMAATATEVDPRVMHCPSGLGHLGGPPGTAKVFSRVSDAEQAIRLWQVTDDLTGGSLSTHPG